MKLGIIVTVIVALVVAAILFPVFLDQVALITGHASIADFSGLEEFANLTPLLLWLSLIGGAIGIGGFAVYKAAKSRKRR